MSHEHYIKWNDLETFTFGDNPSLADDLAALVLAGRKRATCWAARDGKLTEVGKRTVMLDGGGRPCAVLETLELVQRRFEDVDTAFAFEEGEGDSTLAYWRQAHRDYCSRKNQFTEDMLVRCERFRVVETIAGAEGCERVGITGFVLLHDCQRPGPVAIVVQF